MAPTAPRAPRKAPADPTAPIGAVLSDAERDRLETLLDALPPPLEPLDLSALDGFLVGVLLQPQAVPRERWLRHVHDLDARPAPQGAALRELHALVVRRHTELEHAIATRHWFDPWVFDLEDSPSEGPAMPSDVVLPWVAGFAAALDLFPALLQGGAPALREPLATLYANFDPEDLDDTDDLDELIAEVEPAETVADAVEDLVRCTLLLADVTRPRPAPAAARRLRPR